MTVLSMTGFGQAIRETPAFIARTEIRTVNHRFFKLDCSLPDSLSSYEHSIEELLRAMISRGVVRVDVVIEPKASPSRLRGHLKQIKNVYAELSRFKRSMGLNSALSLESILSAPHLWNNKSSQDLPAPTLWPVVSRLLDRAMKDLIKMRAREGRALEQACRQRLRVIQGLTDRIRRHAPEVVRGYEDRLRKRVQEVTARSGATAAETDLAKEIAVMADRCDITEELERLKSHLGQFQTCLQSRGGTGRRLEFILQEMVRETSTLGAKSNHYSISDGAVQIKVELEKLKELVENIE